MPSSSTALQGSALLPTASTTFSPIEYGLTKAVYDANETMAKLSIGRTYLYRLVNLGELTPTKFGKKSLFAAPDIAALLNRRRSAALVKEAA